MGVNLIAVFLLTMCSSVLTLPSTANPAVGRTSSLKPLSDAINPLSPDNVVNFYSLSNAYDLHNWCYEWCCLVEAKDRDNCFKMKQEKCTQLENFSYMNFIAYQLTKLGLGEIASILPVPQVVIDAGMLVAGTGVATVLDGVGTIAEGVAAGANVAIDRVAAGGRLATEGMRTGAALAVDGVTKGTNVATGAVESGAAALGNGASGLVGGIKNVGSGGVATATESNRILKPVSGFGWFR